MAGQRELQQGSHCHRKTWINVLLGILQILLSRVQHGGAQFQVLTQEPSVVEVWQGEDVDFIVPPQAEEETNRENLPPEESSFYGENGRPLRFQPPLLEFGSQPLGLPRAETVYIHNPSPELPVTLLSVFTASKHFFMPSFHRRVIPPRGKTSIKLVFLPTEEGTVESSLFVNTSTHGVLSYQVFGVGVREGSVREVQAKDGLLFFPRIHSIRVTQTQEDSSNITILGLLLDCSLPKPLYNHPQGLCFVGSDEGSFSLQISLRERGDLPAHLDKLKPYVLENIMVLLTLPPVGGAAYPRITVHMLNSGVKKLFVKDVQVLSRTDSAVELKQTQLNPSANNFTLVSTLSCRKAMSAQSRQCCSQISLRVLGDSSVRMFPGLSLTHRGSKLASLLQVRQTHRGNDGVDVWITNTLPFTLSITNITLSHSAHRPLKVVNFTGPVAVSFGCWKLLSLQLVIKTLPVNLITMATLTTDRGFSLQLPLHLHSTGTKDGVVFGVLGECECPCPFRLSRAGRVDWQQSLLPESSSSLWRVDSSLASALCARWNCNTQLHCRWPRLPTDSSSSLDFGATPVNESKVKNLTLRNPSGSVVSMEIRTLSSYPAPLEALDLLTKWFNISPLSVNISTTEFTLLPEHKAVQRQRVMVGEGVVRLMLQPWETKTVSVSFTPTEHKHITSLLLIRNNLSVFDMVTVKGFGAKELLRVGGKLPGPSASLRFNVPQSTLMECRDGLRSSKPLFAIQKSFKVENAGELPLTVMSMNINGYNCQGFGFEVLQCRPFSVDYNSSTEITIAFTPDFTSSWVIRDLTLVTARGSMFPFTLNVTLPHHMLPLCAQVVPGPSWEDNFWMVTLLFTCFSLVGVCLMAFHQARYILSEFSAPSSRSNHGSPAPRENGHVTHNTNHGSNRAKGSCKTYADTGHTSDKGKGRGSPAVAHGTARTQSSSKKGSGGSSSQPQKKHKVSLFYSRYKINSHTAAQAASSAHTHTSTHTLTEEEGREEQPPSHDSDVCILGNGNEEEAMDEPVELEQDAEHFNQPSQAKPSHDHMFPMETTSDLPINDPLPRAMDGGMEERESSRKRDSEKRNVDVEAEVCENSATQRRRTEKAECSVWSLSSKGKKNVSKSRRKAPEGIWGVSEQSVVLLTEREGVPESREPRNTTQTRNHCPNSKLDPPKTAVNPDSPLKQNGAGLTRPRRKCMERRPQWESGSDSGSSSGSVRASRGSWGSWSSASSVEGEKDANANARLHCNSATRKRDPGVQYSSYPTERESYHNVNCTYNTQSSLYLREPCQTPESTPLPSYMPSFADVAAGMERNMDMTNPYVSEGTWPSPAPSVPLTNEFRYNMSDSLPRGPAPPPSGHYNGSFLWNNVTSQHHSPYPYNNQNSYVFMGNANLQSSFSCPEGQSAAPPGVGGWREECVQETTSVWDNSSCVGSKPYFSGTRSLSPMSSLFGSIWTPQSEPCHSHFLQDRPLSAAPPPTPPSPFTCDPAPSCPPKQYSSFNPFGPHMNLDIWNSASNRSSNSQLSNDSGYCADI
ncbi:transmembrane protein 131-like [Chanos chanos]|uniref:Transmembrane protein 131-like n=1 Tax=Chanos chanos TaxID=29144 RepID=A0A6J2WHG8_CHACN|nr:transmembrane protein 131-like [Chanos chanos]